MRGWIQVHVRSGLGAKRTMLFGMAVIMLILGLWGWHGAEGLVLRTLSPTAAAQKGSPEEAIAQLVSEQQMAVRSGDVSRYLQTIDSNQHAYLAEQQHWIDDAVQTVRDKPFVRKVVSFQPGDAAGQKVAIVQQKYQMSSGEERQIEIPVRFSLTSDGWRDADVSFHMEKEGQVLVKYTHDELKTGSQTLLQTARQTQEQLEKIYEWQPLSPIGIKLYGEKEWFRQSVKLSLPDWAAGWHEYGEFIKFDASFRSSTDFIRSAVIHEMGHKMLGEMTHDNAAYWLQEGMAEHYQALLDEDPSNDQLPELPQEALWPLQTLSILNLEALPREEASLYYLQSRMVVDYFLQKYGEREMQEVMHHLKSYPYIEESTSEKRLEIAKRTEDAIEQAIGIPFEQFADAWWQSI